MAAIIINNNTSFGGMTNQTTARLVNLNSQIPRLQEAIATASSGYTGTPGTQFETPIPGANEPAMPNNFGVSPDPAAAGAQGEAYAYAVGVLAEHWATFWEAAGPSIEQLDNGVGAW